VTRQFVWFSLFAAVFVPVGLGSTYLLARHWSKGLRSRFTWAALIAFSTAIVACFTIWVATVGLPHVSPHMAEVLREGPPYPWATAFVLLLAFATAATCRFMPTTGEVRAGTQLQWRRAPESYYHERWATLVVLAMGAATPIVAIRFPMTIAPGFVVGGLDDLCYALEDPYSELLLALALLAIHRAYLAWFRRGELDADVAPTLSPGPFLAVWLAMLATLVFAIPVLACFGFAVWLAPWW
jgi:hypothetical protein